jgi:hypothetical protein
MAKAACAQWDDLTKMVVDLDPATKSVAQSVKEDHGFVVQLA